MNSRAGKRPISHVLTAFYTLSASVILFLATGFLYRVMERGLNREDVHVLADQVEVLRFTLHDKPNDAEALKDEVQSEGAARRFAQYYARVFDKQGKIIIETTGMDQLVPSGKFPSPDAPLEEREAGVRWKSPDNKWFLLMSAWAETGDSHEQRLMQLALDVTQDEAVLSNYRHMLVIVLLLAIACSAVAGSFIAKKGMRPLAEIAEAAQKITASQLHERITPAKWPKELMVLATAFDEMLARLEASFNRLSQFSADLAHEFRTPITNLRVASEVALGRSRTEEEYRRVLESSLEEYERLSRMVDSLLFLARAENAETTLQRSAFDPVKEIEAMVAFYDAAIAEKEIKVAVAGNGQQLRGDAALFRRSINNLLANAVRYTASGGHITIAIRQVPGGNVEVCVDDTGCGIAPEHLPRVFDRFYRVEQTRSPYGTGLGLAIVKSIMELHGGKVSIESKPGAGTRVILNFPNSDPSPE